MNALDLANLRNIASHLQREKEALDLALTMHTAAVRELADISKRHESDVAVSGPIEDQAVTKARTTKKDDLFNLEYQKANRDTNAVIGDAKELPEKYIAAGARTLAQEQGLTYGDFWLIEGSGSSFETKDGSNFSKVTKTDVTRFLAQRGKGASPDEQTTAIPEVSSLDTTTVAAEMPNLDTATATTAPAQETGLAPVAKAMAAASTEATSTPLLQEQPVASAVTSEAVAQPATPTALAPAPVLPTLPAAPEPLFPQAADSEQVGVLHAGHVQPVVKQVAAGAIWPKLQAFADQHGVSALEATMQASRSDINSWNAFISNYCQL